MIQRMSLCLVLLALVACEHTSDDGGAGMRFHLGMTKQDVETVLGRKPEYMHTAFEYREKPSRKEMRETVEYVLEVPGDGVRLFFNHYDEVIRIDPMTAPPAP
jgi:hypothetical protein